MTQKGDGVRIAGGGRQGRVMADDNEWVKLSNVEGDLGGVMEWMMNDKKKEWVQM